MAMLDIIILAALVISIISGIIRGFVREIGSLIGIALGLILAILFGARLAGLMPSLGAPEEFRILAYSAFIFILTMILVIMTFGIIRKALVHGPLKIIDRLFGGLLGLIKGALTIVLVIAVLLASPFAAKIEAKSHKGPLITHFHAAAKPIARRYFSKMTGIFTPDLPPGVKRPDPKVEKELTNLMDSMRKSKSDTDRRTAINRLSPEARTFIQELATNLKSSPDQKRSSSSPSASEDWVWLTDQVNQLSSSAAQ
ncbi:MAG: CvpA family protein [Calditrichota bacterium]